MKKLERKSFNMIKANITNMYLALYLLQKAFSLKSVANKSVLSLLLFNIVLEGLAKAIR